MPARTHFLTATLNNDILDCVAFSSQAIYTD
jgi:hypothetical protein